MVPSLEELAAQENKSGVPSLEELKGGQKKNKVIWSAFKSWVCSFPIGIRSPFYIRIK